MDYGDFQIVCASPERFLKMKKGHVNTRPIKGTRKRGETLEEDLLMRNELKNSEKDKSELLMIVDLERNDLNACANWKCQSDGTLRWKNMQQYFIWFLTSREYFRKTKR